MNFRFYDTLSGKIRTLPRPTKNPVRLFVCGPTVYDDSHIGHARTYLIFDSLVRYLQSQKIKIFYLQNITDIDDKIIKKATQTNRTIKQVAEKFRVSYLNDMKVLGVKSVNKYAPASNYVKEIKSQIKQLIEKGFAYKTNRGIYFEIKKFKDYGKLSRQNLSALRPGWRIETDPNKKDPLDFAIWKFSKSTSEPSWPSPWGRGRPGWHIEDTAITEEIFGSSYELHGGGVDLKFPHHESEIAQARALSGKKYFVKIWLHTGILKINGEKMAKSLNNFITIKDFLKNTSPEIFRLMILGHHYRSPLNYTKKLVNETKIQLDDLGKIIAKLQLIGQLGSKLTPNKRYSTEIKKFKKEFDNALKDDFNTPKALGATFILIKNIQPEIWQLTKEQAKTTKETLELSLKSLGLEISLQNTTKEASKIARDREKLRKNQQFIKADRLRKKINRLGFVVEDTPLGPFLWPKQ